MTHTINNHKAIKYAKFGLIRIPLMVLILIVVGYLLLDWKMPWILFVAGGYFLVSLLLTLILRIHYFQIEVNDEQWIIKFYHLFPLIREFRMIQIPINQLYKVSLRKSTSGLVFIKLLEDSQSGRAAYPEIPLSFITHEQFNELDTLSP